MHRSRGSRPFLLAICRTCRSVARVVKLCNIDTCQRPVLGRGMCPSHYNAWNRAQRRHTIVCAECGQTAQVDRSDRILCGNACRMERARKAAAAANRAAGWAARAARSQLVPYTGPPYVAPVRTVQGKGLWTSGQCRVCGAWFTSQHLDVTCSPECWHQRMAEMTREHKQRRRARKRNAYVAPVNRRKVFEADGYRCHICRRRCDKTKPAPHPRSPTIDHVIPLAAGGTHEPANCRTACFQCNAVKGDRGSGEQFALAF
ncbi:HNH endonuclease [Mycobacterium phage Aminay]|uniref:HNH nuclease domain-containing protein n=1 Tax=Mycobacterium phage Aminay TaxID=2250291 RepID=A0A345KV89_9CAUD|nr:HNH endonuclease [Mycobacterium phage Aminay]AXH46941.1 hypothetical protein SEA_AMINAY_105 [Mycobacterium phage Aminay]